MNFVLYFIIFLIGITVGSFFTLATHRIPLRQDITHTRSYCPNCKHRLEFFDLIPVVSYIMLGGRCRYCKEKIKIKYLLFEAFSGCFFVLFALSVKLNIYSLNFSVLSFVCAGYLFVAGLFVLSGIDKEKHSVNTGVLLYIFIVEVLYIIYLYIVEQANIYRYVIYFFVMLCLMFANNIYFTKKMKDSYPLKIVFLIIAMNIFPFSHELITIYAVGFCFLYLLIEKFFYSLKRKNIVKSDKKEPIPFAMLISVGYIIAMMEMQFLAFWILG